MAWYPCPLCGVNPGQWERVQRVSGSHIVGERLRNFEIIVDRCVVPGCGHLETRWVEKEDPDGRDQKDS